MKQQELVKIRNEVGPKKWPISRILQTVSLAKIAHFEYPLEKLPFLN